ncbi:hypothetical protein DFJ77DRAFT_449290 [Powellomyces hirtus]|nr:hypothetical protein DFJ77DRAFT_449290 [Powellomyces hirtus]
MSYDFAGGSLKLKGSDAGGIKKKKKKSKSQKDALHSAVLKSASETQSPTTITSDTTISITRDDEQQEQKSSPQPRQRRTKTPAELKFEEIQRKRQQDRISKTAASSHKERVAEFNKYLENLSEHYDIPKVGPG